MVSNTSLDRVIVAPESASQAILKGKECSYIPYRCTEECLQGVTPLKGTFVQSGVQWQHWYMIMVVDLMWDAWYGASPYYLVVYFFCGVNLLKLGSEWNCIGLWLQNCVTYNLHKF